MMGNVPIIGKKKGVEKKEKKGRKERGRLHATSENPRCLLELLEMCALWLTGGVFQAEVFAAWISLGLCLTRLSGGCIQSMTLSTRMHSYRPAQVCCSLIVVLGQGAMPRESKEWMPGVNLTASSWISICISQSLDKCDTLQTVWYWYSRQALLHVKAIQICKKVFPPTSFPVSRPLLSLRQGAEFLW